MADQPRGPAEAAGTRTAGPGADAGEWVLWHRQYEDGSPLSRRLEQVQRLVAAALDQAHPGPLRAISMCAGDGRDLLGVMTTHPRGADVRALLVELDAELAAAARARATSVPGQVDVLQGDASCSDAYAGAAPANLVMACGVFGNISDADVQRTIESLPELCAPGAWAIWTRGRFAPDLTPQIRSWFTAAGFDEVEFVAVPDTTMAVGAHRLVTAPRALRSDQRLFTFLPAEQRPSSRSRVPQP